MRLGVLETGKVNAALEADHGLYPAMFKRGFAAAAPELDIAVFTVLENEFPASPTSCDAWLVTGSKFGVYDPEPWIPPLKAFLRSAYDAGAPIIGVCFGHQILAEALGGRVEKSSKGWGVGVHRYEQRKAAAWSALTPVASGELHFHAMHQDQVVDLPADATVIASSDFCPYASLAYGDIESPRAISVQPHPEFVPDFARDLIKVRRNLGVPEAVADASLATIGKPVDNDAAFKWMSDFMRKAQAR